VVRIVSHVRRRVAFALSASFGIELVQTLRTSAQVPVDLVRSHLKEVVIGEPESGGNLRDQIKGRPSFGGSVDDPPQMRLPDACAGGDGVQRGSLRATTRMASVLRREGPSFGQEFAKSFGKRQIGAGCLRRHHGQDSYPTIDPAS
jgi:hypothetical protein